MEKLFGRTYESYGNTSSDLILKTRGLVKVLIGKSLVDIVKDGKVNADVDVIKEVSSKEDINDNGIFIVNAQDVYLKYNDSLLSILDSSNLANVSYLPQLNITYESKLLAWKNLGLYYDSIEDATSEITNGFAFIENGLYTIINSLAYRTLSSSTMDNLSVTTLTANQGKIGGISLSKDSILLDLLTSVKSTSQTLMRFDTRQIFIDTPVTIKELYSSNGSFSLTTDGNISRLKVTYAEILNLSFEGLELNNAELINAVFKYELLSNNSESDSGTEESTQSNNGPVYDDSGNITEEFITTEGFPKLLDNWILDKDIDGQVLVSAAWVRNNIGSNSLPIATKDTLGGVKIGTGLSISEEGLLTLEETITKLLALIDELSSQVSNLLKAVLDLLDKLNSLS